MSPPVVPDCYLAKSAGPFPLVAGPLCGLFTDQVPIGIDLIVHLDYRDRLGRHWTCSYQLDTAGRYAPRYLFLAIDRVG